MSSGRRACSPQIPREGVYAHCWGLSLVCGGTWSLSVFLDSIPSCQGNRKKAQLIYFTPRSEHLLEHIPITPQAFADLPVHSPIEHIFPECPLCTRNCCRPWRYDSKQDRGVTSQTAYILLEANTLNELASKMITDSAMRSETAQRSVEWLQGTAEDRWLEKVYLKGSGDHWSGLNDSQEGQMWRPWSGSPSGVPKEFKMWVGCFPIGVSGLNLPRCLSLSSACSRLVHEIESCTVLSTASPPVYLT